MITKLLKQGAHYASGSLMLSLASLISFPILTRVLPMSEYGILSLITSFLGLLVALNKAGLQQSVLRYYQKGSLGFDSTLLWLSLSLIVLITLVIQLVNYFFPYPLIQEYFQFLCLLAALQAFKSVVLSCYTASLRSIWVNVFNVCHKYFGLVALVFFLFFVKEDALSVLYSLLLTELLLVIALLILWLKPIQFTELNKPLIKKLLIYGLPLMVVEFLQIAHAFIDRFMIEYYLGTEMVASYVAPYSMADMISNILFGAMATALVPIYMALWKEGKKQEVADFISDVSDYFLLLFPVIITGAYLISEPLMMLLASEKYKSSSYILPIALAGIAIFSSTFIYSAGLRLKTTQTKVVRFVFESLIINILLNYIFIKQYGILASALSTIVSYLWMSIRYYYASSEVIKIKVNFNYLLKGGVISLLMFLCLDNIFLGEEPLIILLLTLIIGGGVGLGLLYVFDSKLRMGVATILSKLKEKPKH